MTGLQRLVLEMLPRSWAERAWKSSEGWKIRCTRCGATRSVWDTGGIRWGAASVGNRRVVYCLHCRRWSAATVVWEPDDDQ